MSDFVFIDTQAVLADAPALVVESYKQGEERAAQLKSDIAALAQGTTEQDMDTLLELIDARLGNPDYIESGCLECHGSGDEDAEEFEPFTKEGWAQYQEYCNQYEASSEEMKKLIVTQTDVWNYALFGLAHLTNPEGHYHGETSDLLLARLKKRLDGVTAS